MTWETMSWTFTPRKRRKSYGRSVAQTFVSASLPGASEDFMTLLYLLELPWSKDSTYSPLIVTPHRTLNSCPGVVSESDLLCASETEILKGLSDQGVTQMCVRWAFFHGLYSGAETC
ncbi:hypothetical protein TNCV_3135021 [Trichonephila clavipes]|nr:hypothetical protein TNCV_3135021 [Trichonephila clavipes]